MKANSASVIVNNTIALKANDQCTPINPPTTPTVRPLKALRPMLAIEYKPIKRPRMGGGERSWTIVCAIEEKARFKTPAKNSSVSDKK